MFDLLEAQQCLLAPYACLVLPRPENNVGDLSKFDCIYILNSV
jgi:hypothetical protein